MTRLAMVATGKYARYGTFANLRSSVHNVTCAVDHMELEMHVGRELHVGGEAQISSTHPQSKNLFGVGFMPDLLLNLDGRFQFSCNICSADFPRTFGASPSLPRH